MAYDWERQEWRSAVAQMTEMERMQACRHTRRGLALVCPDCGDAVDRGEL